MYCNFLLSKILHYLSLTRFVCLCVYSSYASAGSSACLGGYKLCTTVHPASTTGCDGWRKSVCVSWRLGYCLQGFGQLSV